MNIKVKFDDFINYQKEHNTYYLDKKNKYRLWSNSKDSLFKSANWKINEMFDGIKTNYEFSPESTPDNMCIIFYSKSKTKYRFDLIKEKNTQIHHLAFTLDNRKIEDYDEVTNKDESVEIFGGLSYILKDLSIKLNIDEFCIGATGDKEKDEIYQYMMLYVKSWQKRNTNLYNLGWGLYFKI